MADLSDESRRDMTAPVSMPVEARLVADLPGDPAGSTNPKWDGVRALVYRDGDEIELLSKSGKSLALLSEVVASIAAVGRDRFILDGEFILPIDNTLSFGALSPNQVTKRDTRAVQVGRTWAKSGEPLERF